MPKTKPNLGQFSLVDPSKEKERTIGLLRERLEGVLRKCEISYEGEGRFDVYGNPHPHYPIFISPAKGTCIVGVSTSLDLTQCLVSERNDLVNALNSGYDVRVGRTSQELDLPCFIYRNHDRKRKFETIPVKGIVLPANY